MGRLALRYSGQNGVKLPDSFRERGRTGLQDISGLHFVDVAGTDGINRDSQPSRWRI